MNSEHFPNFESFLNQTLKERGLTLKRLAELSGVSLHYLELLEHGDFAHLPAAPYVRGFLVRIAPILEFDADYWWERVKEQQEIARSGGGDVLPQNRFIKRSYKKYILGAVAALLVILYFAIRFTTIAGRPIVSVDFPGTETSGVTVDRILFIGTIQNGTSLLINDEPVPFSTDGKWQKELALSPGLNTITITAKKFLGKEISLIRQVFYTVPSATSTPIINSTSSASSTTP